MIRKFPILKTFRTFRCDDRGVAMTEAILVVPVLTAFAVGMLEFGSMFWQREQIETGLRDAARYMARCRHPVATCEGNARQLAYYGTVGQGTALRVPDWDAQNSQITFPRNGTTVSATTTHQLIKSPLFGFLGITQVTITANHDQRVIGW